METKEFKKSKLDIFISKFNLAKIKEKYIKAYRKININRLDSVLRLKEITKYPTYIKRIKHPTDAEIVSVFNYHNYYLPYIKEIPKNLQISFVKKDALNIRYINSPCREAIEIAVRKNPDTIKDIKNPSSDIAILATTAHMNPYLYAIHYVKDPTIELQKIAVQEDGYAIRYIKHPSLEIQKMAIENDPKSICHIDHPTAEIQKMAVMKDIKSIEFIEYPTREVQLLELQKNICSIDILLRRNPIPEVQLAAVQRYGSAIRVITKPTDEIIHAALYTAIEEKEEDTIEYIFKRKLLKYKDLDDATKLLIEMM